MNGNRKILVVVLAFCALFFAPEPIDAQASEEYTGNIVDMNGPRLRTGFFTLRINNLTTDEQARQYLSVLQDGGQDRALDAIRNQNLGTFSVAGISAEQSMSRAKRWLTAGEEFSSYLNAGLNLPKLAAVTARSIIRSALSNYF